MLLALHCLPLIFVGAATLASAQDADIQWRHRAHSGPVEVMANPLTSVSRASFYEARGFAAVAIQPYAESCGFSFGFRNGGMTPIAVKLADWRVIGADGALIAFKLPEAWDAEWERAGVPPFARIAFRWAQFQSESTFEPGDWIMGMATLTRIPAPPFRLLVRYQDEKGDHEIVLDRLECARD
jgi:hypothetical protein